MTELKTLEEKVDFLYKKEIEREKKEKIRWFTKWGFRIFIIVYMLYFYFFALPWILEKVKRSITPDLSGINVSQIWEGSIDKIKELLDY